MRHKLFINDFQIPENDLYELESIDFQITRKRDNWNSEHRIAVIANPDDRFSVFYNYDFNNGTVIYARVILKYKSINGSEPIPDQVLTTIALDKNFTGFKFSDTILMTPTIEIDNIETNLDEHLTIRTSDMKIYSGRGLHKSTTYLVEDTNGHVYYKRERDEENLTSIKIKTNEFPKQKALLIKVQHHTDTNANSNYGVLPIFRDIHKTKILKVEVKDNTLYSNKPNCFKVTFRKPNVTKIEYQLFKKIAEKESLVENGKIDLETLKTIKTVLDPYLQYKLKVTVTTDDGMLYENSEVYNPYIANDKIIKRNKDLYYQPYNFKKNSKNTFGSRFLTQSNMNKCFLHLDKNKGYLTVEELNNDEVVFKKLITTLDISNMINNSGVKINYFDNNILTVSFIINTNNGLKQKVIVFRHCGYFDKEFKNITQLTSFNFTPITLTNGTVSNLIRLTNEKICFLENIDGVLTVRTFEPKTNIITNFLETNLDNNIDGELMSVDNEKSLFVNRKGEIFKLDFINSTTSKLQTVNADLLNTDSNGVIIGLFEVFENVKGQINY